MAHKRGRVSERTGSPDYPKLLIRTRTARLEETVQRERPAGVGKGSSVLVGDSSFITRMAAPGSLPNLGATLHPRR